jgi:hypothetical protein
MGKATFSYGGRVIDRTIGGVSLTPESEVVRLDDIDQIDGAADIIHFNQKMSIKFTIAAIMLQNIAMGWGLKSAATEEIPSNYDRLTIQWDINLPEQEFKIFGTMLNGKKVIVTIPRAKIIPGGEMSWNVKEKAKIPITIESLADDAGIHGYIDKER